MIVVLLESSVTPGVEPFGDVYGLIVGERLGADEPCALRHIDRCTAAPEDSQRVVQPEDVFGARAGDVG